MRTLISLLLISLPAFAQDGVSVRTRNGNATNLNIKGITVAQKIVATNFTGNGGGLTNMSFLDVKRDFGAIGDGVANDTAPVNAALAALKTLRTELYFPPGDYNVGALNLSDLTPWYARTNGSVIRGAGLNASRLVCISNDVIMLNMIGQTALTVSDLGLVTSNGIVAQAGILIARDLTSEAAPYNNFERLAILGHFSKAAIVHMGAEITDYNLLRVRNEEPRPCFYAARGNYELLLTNNIGVVDTNDTTANVIRNSTFETLTNGGTALKLINNVQFIVRDCTFLSAQAVNNFITLVAEVGGGDGFWTGKLDCSGNLYEGQFATPYYLDCPDVAAASSFMNLIEANSRFNCFGWLSATNHLFASYDSSKVSIYNWKVRVDNSVYGSTETFNSIYDSDLLLPLTNALNSVHSSAVTILVGAQGNTKIKADSVTVGSAKSGFGFSTTTRQHIDADLVSLGSYGTTTLNVISNRVGIGTTNPVDKLEIRDTDKAVTTLYDDANLRIVTTDALAIDKGGSISLGGVGQSPSDSYGFGFIKGAKENALNGDISGYLSLGTSRSGIGSVEGMRITSSGNAFFTGTLTGNGSGLTNLPTSGSGLPGTNTVIAYGNVFRTNSIGISTNGTSITGHLAVVNGNVRATRFDAGANASTSGAFNLQNSDAITSRNGANSADLSIMYLDGDDKIRFARTTQIDANLTIVGHFTFGTDNTYDIGASGANRPRNGYFGSSVSAGDTITGGTTVQVPSAFVANSANVRTGSGIYWGWSSEADNSTVSDTTLVRGSAAATILLGNGASPTDFNRLQFGGTSSSFPSIKRNGAGIDFRLADDSAYTSASVASLAYNATTWNGNNTVPTRDDIRDKIEAMVVGNAFPLTVTTLLGTNGSNAGGLTRGLVYNTNGAGAGYTALEWHTADGTTVDYFYQDANGLRFKASGTDLVIEDGLKIVDLSGTGTRFVTADPDGVLATSTDASITASSATFSGNLSARTNIAQFDVSISDFVIGTRYTNSPRRSFVAASFQLAAAVAGTAAVTLNVEQAGVTNKLTVSSGPLAGLTTIEPLSLMVGPGAFYYFADTSSGAGAVASIVAGTSSKTDW